MSRRLVIWIVIIIVFAALLVASAASSTDIDSVGSPLRSQGVTYVGQKLQDGDAGDVAVVRILGVITNGDSDPAAASTGADDVVRQLEEIGESGNFDAVLLEVNSPGGGVLASAEIADQVRRMQSKYDMKVISWMRDVAASGGYYVSAPADAIIAAPSTFTGSLGVILEYVTAGELIHKVGVKPVVIKSGDLKDLGSPYRDATAREREIFQSIIDEAYDEFVEVISDGRSIPLAETRELADGRIYSGSQALELDLVDELGTRRDAYDLVAEQLDLDGDGEDLTVVEFNRSFGLFEVLSASAPGLDPMANVNLRTLTEGITGIPAPSGNGFVSLEYRAVP